MSKVKIQGNASGTGVFTIEAPGTNDPRTLTLPNSTGTLLDENSSLPAANLTGTIADARLPDPLPAIDGSSLTGVGVTDSKFYAYITSQFNNVTGDGTTVDILGASKWTLKYNIGSDFDDGGGATEGTYTAPETGKYLFTWSINLSGVTTSYTSINLWMVTSNGNSRVSATHGNAAQSNGELKLQGAIITDLDASDTAYLRIIVGGSTKVINIDYSGTTHSHWQGALLA